MTARTVIGIAGLIGAGKSTAAWHLAENHNFRIIKFAGPLKDMARALGLNEREIEGDLKEKPCELLGGKTPRFALQTLGTEWGRDTIDQGIWIKAWRKACDAVPEGVGIVADDLRFTNEATAIRALSPFASLIRITRPALESSSGHVSELQSFGVDHRIVNGGTVEELCAAIDALVIRADGCAV